MTDLPGVVVYSAQRLQIDTPGSTEERLTPTGGAYNFRYRGLRLLEHTGGHYFLVTDEWNPDTGTVVMLAQGGQIRLEFVLRRGPT